MLTLCTLVPHHHDWPVLPFSCSMLPPSLLGAPGPPSPSSPSWPHFPQVPGNAPLSCLGTYQLMDCTFLQSQGFAKIRWAVVREGQNRLCRYTSTQLFASQLSCQDSCLVKTEWTTGHPKTSYLHIKVMSSNIYIMCTCTSHTSHVLWHYTFCDIEVLW